MNKLLPCPFCGSKARICEDNGRIVDSWMIGCTSFPCGGRIYHHGTREEIRKMWNKRTVMDKVIYGN